MDFSEQLIQQVWEKARANGDVDVNEWREDECGAWIRRTDFGKTDSDFAWRIVNVSAGGPDTVDNLRPLHIENAYDIANGKPKRRVTADRTGLATFERTFEPRNRKA